MTNRRKCGGVAALGALVLVHCMLACGTSDPGNTQADSQQALGGSSEVTPAAVTGGSSSQLATGGAGGSTTNASSIDEGGVGTVDMPSGSGGQVATGGRSSASTSPSTGGFAATGGQTSGWSGGTTSGGRASTSPVTSVDILYMIDNSPSMADKQQVLSASLPQLLAQLIQPNCVDASGQQTEQSQLTASGPVCATGTLEYLPVNDIHLGVVSSSLGDHGAYTSCAPGLSTQYTDPATGETILQPPDVNDMGWLQGTTLRGAQALQSDPTIAQSEVFKLDAAGFLSWSAGASANIATRNDMSSATAAFKDMVVATGQSGCGYEAQLESWFRFLVDPVPPKYPIAHPDPSQIHRTGVDDVLLAQRAAFLRPNSLVLIVMLSDENDCSVRDTDVGWVVAATSVHPMAAGSPACATNPNDRCCYSCTAAPPAGCVACASPAPSATDDSSMQANLRCYNQKRRLGFDFLYPTSRYYVALTHRELCPDQTYGDMDCDCTQANAIGAACSPGSRRLPNPLFSQTVGTDSQNNPVSSLESAPARADNSNVFLAGIVGVPWQDVSEPSSQSNGALLKYIPVTDARWSASGGIWEQIYGDDALNIVPGDVHMLESIDPRSGLAAPTSASAMADPKNGHEYNTARSDLQYACIFALEGAAPAKPCACDPTASNYAMCRYLNPSDCCNLTYTADGAGGPGGTFDKPICQNPTTGSYESTQYYAKAYPSLREIAVLHDYAVGPATYSDLGGTENAIVTSICPKMLTSGQEADPGYGYNPIARAIISRLKVRLNR